MKFQTPQWLLNVSKNHIGTKCTKALLVNFDYNNFECIKIAVSKALGLGIVLGSAVVKVPQIIKIFYSGSAAGLSLTAYMLELIAAIVTLAYNLRRETPFSTFGECFFIFAQNIIILAMMGAVKNQRLLYTVVIIFISILTSGLLLPGYVSDSLITKLQTATIPMLMCSRIPQIYAIWKEKSHGQLSIITVLLVALGSLARVYTALQETANDMILVGSFIIAAGLNNFIFLQIIYYALINRGNRTSVNKKKV